jgi:hypothetical protein
MSKWTDRYAALNVLSCSFCGKKSEDAGRLIQGEGKLADGRSLCICAECVARCAALLVDGGSGRHLDGPARAA